MDSRETEFSQRVLLSHLLVFRLVKAVGQAALPTVVSVEVTGHEDASAALVSWALPAQTVDLPVLVHLNSQGNVTLQPEA